MHEIVRILENQYHHNKCVANWETRQQSNRNQHLNRNGMGQGFGLIEDRLNYDRRTMIKILQRYSQTVYM